MKLLKSCVPQDRRDPKRLLVLIDGYINLDVEASKLMLSGDSSSSPIFIVGMPRSGTTMLSCIISRHPNISISPESHFLNFWMHKYRCFDLMCQEEFDCFWNAFSQSDRFSYFGIEAWRTLARIRTYPNQDFKAVFLGLMQEYLSTTNKKRWGEKTPAHYNHLNTILEWFPRAKILWVIRDPRAVVASLSKVDWASSFTHINAERWRDSTQLFKQKWARNSRIQLVKYEEFVKDPRRNIEMICQFIEEPYALNMLDSDQDSITVVNRSGWAQEHFELAQADIHLESLNKWKRNLNRDQVAIIENITGHLMREFGYQTMQSPLSLRQLFVLAKEKAKYKYLARNS